MDLPDLTWNLPELVTGEEIGRAQELLDALRGRSVYIETYGCRYNFGDTAKLVEVLRHYGSTIVDNPDEADAIIVNTCTVVGPTERRMLRRLAGFRDRDLYVTGCMPGVQREAILAVCSPTIIPPEMIHATVLFCGDGCRRGCRHCPAGAGLCRELFLLYHPLCPGPPEKFSGRRDPCSGTGVCAGRDRLKSS